MPEPQKPFYLTTPIYYVNARPHIGHAYTTIVADVLARRHRLQGPPTAPGELPATFFLTGTDEHGQKIERSAAAAGIPPQEFTDQVSAQFRSLWDRMGLTYDRYIRTTDPAHKAGVQHLFTQLWNNGFIYLDKYTGAYCVSDEAFVDAPVGTPCPDCGRLLEQVTEENFFFRLSSFQEKLLNLIESNELLIEPSTARNEVLSFLRGNAPSPTSENEGLILSEAKNLRISPETAPSSAPTSENEGLILSEAKNLRIPSEAAPTPLPTTAAGAPYTPGALKDLSISRSSFTWGIPVPHAVQQAAGATQPHVIYVWLDALANYITAIGYPDGPSFQKYWPADLHLVGKEITRFHCVYWPAFLMAAGLPTPRRITANGWLLFDNAKMSKSRGNVVRTETILEGFGEHVYAKQFPESSKRDRDLFASDVLRYFLLREIPFGQDGSFSFDAMVTRYNADLANGYGNLVSRTLNMIQQYFNGEYQNFSTDFYFDFVMYPGTASHNWIGFGDVEALRGDPAAQKRADDQEPGDSLGGAIETYIYDLQFTQATETLMQAIAAVDGYITQHAPWKLAKLEGSREKLAEVLMNSAEAVRYITACAYPVLPHATAAVWQQLGLGDIETAAANGELKNLQWGGLKPGTKLGPLSPIFPRAPKELADIMSDLENPTLETRSSQLETVKQNPATPEPATAAASAPTPVAPPLEPGTSDLAPVCTIDDFIKIDLRIAEIKLAERIPKADKLLRLEVDLGPLGTRQILSGIAEHYAPEDLIGRRIIVIANLAPRKMRGLESHGMLLAASEEGGKPYLATVPEGVPLGTRLK